MNSVWRLVQPLGFQIPLTTDRIATGVHAVRRNEPSASCEDSLAEIYPVPYRFSQNAIGDLHAKLMISSTYCKVFLVQHTH